MFNNLSELIERLKNNPKVIGIIIYGSRSVNINSLIGDFDLFVFLDYPLQDIESIHFYVGETSVDLSLRCINDLNPDKLVHPSDIALLANNDSYSNFKIVYYRQNILTRKICSFRNKWNKKNEKLTDDEISKIRFLHRHALDKIRNNIECDYVTSAFILSTNIFWLIQNYFRVRLIPYQGEKKSIEWLKINDKIIYSCIKKFFKVNNLYTKIMITDELTNLILEPIGGPWKKGELLSFGRNPFTQNLLSEGYKAFSELFQVAFKEVK